MRFATLVLLAATAIQKAAADHQTFTVLVGADTTGNLANVFTPNQVVANVGDTVRFEFQGKNHSVTQSSFANPCTQQFNTQSRLPGIDSGFIPVAAGEPKIAFEIMVKQANSPIWFFCNQASHCNNGMVFAINAPSTGEKTFEAWTQLLPNAQHPDPALRQTADFTPAPGEVNQADNNRNQNGGSAGANFNTRPVATATRGGEVFSTIGAFGNGNNVNNNGQFGNGAANAAFSLGPQVTGPVQFTTLSPNTVANNLPTAIQLANSGATKLSGSTSIWLALGLGLVGAIIA